MKQRITYFDFLRGLAIMMVVGIHTYALGRDSIAMRQLLNTAVPLFLAISGYFTIRKTTASVQEHLQFLKKQIPKVYIPTLIWSFPLLALTIYSGRGINICKPLLYFFLCGFSIYYFIALIIQCYATLPAIGRCLRHHKYLTLGASSAISLVWVAGVVWLTTIRDIEIPLILYAGPLPCWLMFFVLGAMIGQKADRAYSITLPVLLTLAGLALSLLESDFLFSRYGKGAGIKPSAFIYSAGMVSLLFSEKCEKLFLRFAPVYKPVVSLGRLSFGIYLVHCYFIGYVIHRFPIDSWPASFALTLLLTALFLVVLKKALPAKFHIYLGL